ncbi:hypothetical protein ACS0TY_023077 [Phlomoides rotata]
MLIVDYHHHHLSSVFIGIYQHRHFSSSSSTMPISFIVVIQESSFILLQELFDCGRICDCRHHLTQFVGVKEQKVFVFVFEIRDTQIPSWTIPHTRIHPIVAEHMDKAQPSTLCWLQVMFLSSYHALTNPDIYPASVMRDYEQEKVEGVILGTWHLFVRL